MTRQVARPDGSPPPEEAPHRAGRVALVPLAAEVARRHLDAHPDDVERYGADLAREWAVHDMQHVLSWAFAEAAGVLQLERQVDWLARVLGSRGYPLENLAGCPRIAADVVSEHVADADAVAASLRGVA